jgi:AGCS family alanine or glycine:cation symporter
VFAGFGSQFVSVAMIFFTYSTIMAYYFYAESSIIYLFRDKNPKREKLVIRIFQVVILTAVIYGAIREADVVWQMGDIGVGLMAWGTLISIILLFPKAIRALKEYEKQIEN